MSPFAFSLVYLHGVVMRETDCPSSQIIKSYMLFEIERVFFFFLIQLPCNLELERKQES